MTTRNEGLTRIVTIFAESGWDLIADPAKAWLEESISSDDLIPIIEKANIDCGSCGCELDHLYKQALEMLLEEKTN